jgi:preprotein translocase subunit SecG
MSNLIHTIAVVTQVLSALGVILLVLLQHGKGADMGAAFGSGASGSLFGATGSANFLSRLTGGLAALFFISTLGLAFLTNDRPRAGTSLMEGAVPQVPAGPGSEIPGTRLPAAPPKDVPSVGGASPAAPASGAVPPAPASGAVPPAPAAPGSAVPGVPSAGESANPGGGSGSSMAVPSESGNSSASGAGAGQNPK